MNPAPLLPLLLLLGLGSVLADPAQVKWCLKSDLEFQKCRDLSAKVSEFSCVKKPDTKECIKAIKSGEADAITLDSGDIYFAGLNNYDLQPIIAENYGDSSEGCYYAVAVVKKSSNFKIRDLRGKKSCHTGLKKSAGWNIPVGTLLSLDILQWGGNEDETVEDVVSEFFSQSCAPGAVRGSKLCALCKKDCSRSQKEPYYDYNGAFQCLADDAGDVAFVKHLTVPDSEKANYELLCKDNTRAPIDNYKTCHLAKVPAHAVVTRKDPQLADRIWTSLNAAKAKGFDLFSSEAYSTKNLMFKDSTVKLVKLPAKVNSLLYLGSEYMDILRSINKDSTQDAVSSSIKWCAVGHAESQKCKNWMFNNPAIECDVADSVEECMERIVLKSADAMAVDGGQVYTAGKCGLVPAMVEQYDEAKCNTPGAPASSYYAVAVVKKGSGLTWDSLKGKRSCHTGIGRTAGWNIPMGRIYGQTGNCDFTKFFSSGCAPGANASSPFCTQCIGSGQDVGDTAKCKASAEERYYGYAGAFRCLVEGAGDVAFIKHTIVGENSDGNGPEWAAGLKSADYELICPGKAGPVPITDFGSCHLAIVPAHAVVTRQGKRNEVIRILQEQQQKFGSRGTGDVFSMFQSEGGKNLLFKDSTRCLQVVPAGQNYQTFLGPDYMQAMTSLRKCSDTASELEKACSFSCQ